MPQDCLGGSMYSHVMGVSHALWLAFAALHFYILIAAAKDLVWWTEGLVYSVFLSAVPGLSWVLHLNAPVAESDKHSLIHSYLYY